MKKKTSEKTQKCLKRGEKSMMNKMFKKVSAVALAAAMTLGSSVAAQAATMNVYMREWHQNSLTDTYEGTPVYTFGTEPVLVLDDIEKGMTYKQALQTALTDPEYRGKVNFGWVDGNEQYLQSITLGSGDNQKTWLNDGENTEAEYENGKMVGAIWVGKSWMWYTGDKIGMTNTRSYPETTLGNTLVPVVKENSDDEVFSIVLSYDKTQFGWGTKENATGTN